MHGLCPVQLRSCSALGSSFELTTEHPEPATGLADAYLCGSLLLFRRCTCKQALSLTGRSAMQPPRRQPSQMAYRRRPRQRHRLSCGPGRLVPPLTRRAALRLPAPAALPGSQTAVRPPTETPLPKALPAARDTPSTAAPLMQRTSWGLFPACRRQAWALAEAASGKCWWLVFVNRVAGALMS